MNENEKIIEMLSAEVDGSAGDPAALEAALRAYPDLERRLRQMKTLSARLRELPAPDVHPAFVTRVMARIAEEPQPRATHWLRWLPVPLAAAVAVVIGFALFPGTAGKPASAPAEMTPVATAVPVAASKLPADDIFDLAAVEPLGLRDTVDGMYDDTLADDPAERSLILTSVEQAVEANLDLESVLQSLTPDEIDALRMLIQQNGSSEGSLS